MATLRPERILPTLGGRCKPFTTAGAPVVQWRLVPASYHALFCLFGYHRQHPPTACSTPGDQTPRALKTSSKPGVIAGAWVLNFADSPLPYLPTYPPTLLVVWWRLLISSFRDDVCDANDVERNGGEGASSASCCHVGPTFHSLRTCQRDGDPCRFSVSEYHALLPDENNDSSQRNHRLLSTKS